MAGEERPVEILDHIGYVRRLQDEEDPEQRAPVPRLDADQDVGQAREAVRHQTLNRQRRYRQNELPQQAAVRRRQDNLRYQQNRPARPIPRLNSARVLPGRVNPLPPLHSLGAFGDSICEQCYAVLFSGEKFNCCLDGKVRPPALSEYPDELKDLLTSNSARGNGFRKLIRVYNNLFSFASMSANIRPPPGHGPPCFRICGQICHRYGSLLPAENNTPMYNQLYIIEAGQALNQRMANPSATDCDRAVMEEIQTVLNRDSRFAAAYRNMKEIEEAEQAQAIQENREPSQVSMIMRPGNDMRRANAPLHEEVAAIFVGDDGAPPTSRDIVVYPRGQPLHKIDFSHPFNDPMTYPLIFPHGDFGWNTNMLYQNQDQNQGGRKRVSMLEYYKYRLAIRPGFSALHRAGKLFQQYLVDAYTKVEGERLHWCKVNQHVLRVDSYNGLFEALNSRAERENLRLGRVVVLPSSFTGGPRHMQQLYLDAMCMVAKLGKPDIFLTFTCNPKWEEITENLLPGQTASDRPDLVARVFRMKLEAIKKDIFEHGVLGKTVAYVYVIEYQKRGLPHAHFLIHFADGYKLHSSFDIDSLISAEIPDPDEDPELYEIIKNCMMHGPCGVLNPNSPCMNEEGKCSKGYPKEFNEVTRVEDNGYPLYKRPDNGRTIRKGNHVLDNRYVVPYNRYLCKKYNAHINVEACCSVKAVQYLYKYIYKGHDVAHVEINETLAHDEIKTYLDARYVSAPEAAWRLFTFPMHKQSHSTIRLALHLPNEQPVFFREGQEQQAMDQANNEERNTMLTAWFKLNQEDESANQYLYTEVPYHYTFNKKWKKRQNNKHKLVARIYNATIREGERFFLRVLLLNVPGATSFEFLRTYNDVVYDSFREACIARGLLEDDHLWTNTMAEVVIHGSGAKIRETFCMLLIHGEPNDPLQLWELYRMDMMSDFIRNHPEDVAEQMALQGIERQLQQFGKSLNDFALPLLEQALPDEDAPNPLQMRQEAEEIRPRLNDDQTAVSNAVIQAVLGNDHQTPQVFFLDGPGGTGKTFTYNYIIRVLAGQHKGVATCAWTGIAAILLENGTTLHSVFKLPVPVLDNSTCNIKANSKAADYLRAKDIIIIDECSMIPKYALEAIDALLRDICNSNVPFAGKVVLLGGDFRQTLPIVRRGGSTQIMEVCLKRCRLWRFVHVFQLRTNMRAQEGEQRFADFLIQLGDGRLPMKENNPYEGSIEIPRECILDGQNQDPCEEIIDSVFGNFEGDVFKKVILTPTNVDALKVNEKILTRRPGDVTSYLSFDSIVSDSEEEIARYPLEFLNSLCPSGMPPHALNLKVGSICMLLRNLSLKDGLCNGTRLIVRALQQNVIDVEIFTGVHAGKRHFIPRVTLAPADTGMPFQLKRTQFPLRLSYAMTVNKSQGQTFDKVGIFLSKPCFGHGQLYVAFSRAKSFQGVKVKIVKNDFQGDVRNRYFTKNIVYRQIL